jgi:nucleoid DNA-binding protein
MSLINKITSDSTLSKKNCENLFTQIFDAIKSSVINRESVLIDNFGLFKVERRKMQTMIDYNRKVVVLLPPKDKIIFEFRNGSVQKEITSSEKTDFPSKKIIALVSGNTKIDEVSVYEFYNILFEVIREYLEGKRNVNIIEFGKFKINRKNKISFSPAKKFSEKVNYNFNNLKTHIVRSLNKDEIKKLYKEGRQYEDEEDYLHEEAAETVTETIPEVQEKIPEITDKKEIEIPVTDKKEITDEYEITGDTILKEDLLMEDTDEEDIELKEKFTADFKILEEIFEEKKEIPEIIGEKVTEPGYDIRIIQELEEAEQLAAEKEIIKQEKPEDITVIPVQPETIIQEPGLEAVEEELLGDTYEKTASTYIPEEPAETIITEVMKEPTEPVAEEPPEIITEKPSEQLSYTKETESPITEKIVSDFEEKIKMFKKKEEEDRKSYEKVLDKEKVFPEEVSLPKFTGITTHTVEEVKPVSEPEISFASTLDKIMKDDDEEIEISVMKIDEEIIKPETFPDITETIKEEIFKPEIIPTIITREKDTLITEEPPSKTEAAEEIITDSDDIPISQIYKKLRYGFPEEGARKETAEPVETTEPKIEKPVEFVTPKTEIPLPPVEISTEKFVIPEEIIPVKTETDFSVKEDIHFEEGLTYEEKKNKFEDILKKYSEDFQPGKITLKIDDDTTTEEIQIPVAPVPDKDLDLKIADTPFKPVDESTKVTSTDETLNDIKNFLDEFDKKKSSSSDITKKEDDSSPFKKIDDDFPKSMDDYFEDIKKYLDKKDLKDSGEDV